MARKFIYLFFLLALAGVACQKQEAVEQPHPRHHHSSGQLTNGNNDTGFGTIDGSKDVKKATEDQEQQDKDAADQSN